MKIYNYLKEKNEIVFRDNIKTSCSVNNNINHFSCYNIPYKLMKTENYKNVVITIDFKNNVSGILSTILN